MDDSNALVTNRAATPLNPDGLEFAVEYALERRWLDEFDATAQHVLPRAKLRGDEARILRVKGFAHSGDARRSLDRQNMQNVLSSFRGSGNSILFALRGIGSRAALYMGVRRFDPTRGVPTSEGIQVLQRALTSNFPGITLDAKMLDADETQSEITVPLGYSKFLGCVTGIPSLKQDAAALFTQSMDRLIDALRGEAYTFAVIAEPLTETMLVDAVAECRRLSGEIHTRVRQSEALAQSYSNAENISRGEAANINAGTASWLQMLFGVQVGRSWQNSSGTSTSRSMGLTLTREVYNKTAEFCEKALDHSQMRLQQGRNLGFWNVGVFLASENRDTFMRAQGIVRGLFSGHETHFEPLRVTNLSDASAQVRDSLESLWNPTLELENEIRHPFGNEFLKFATPLNTEELSILLGFPQREVPGIPLRALAEFGVNPLPVADGIVLGKVLDQGAPLDEILSVPPLALTQHTFITGFTGAGKTNTCLVLLRQAARRNIPFLIIEPAKTEYRVLLADAELGAHVQVFTLGEETTSKFRLNPFEFVRGFSLLTHIDYLRAVFNASFPMYASMPYILEQAVLEIYADRGWDIASSKNRFVDVADPNADYTPYLPTLGDLYARIDSVVKSKNYAQQLTLDITAALKARLGSLMTGGKGYMLNTQRSTPIDALLERPTVLELRQVGDDDEKAFLMALLLILIYEASQIRHARQNFNTQTSGQHVTLIEEAHRLLKNLPSASSMESANPRGKAVEMFTDILAEVREYGEGFIIVDQVPSKLTPDVVKNTNLKIVHRLPAEDDRRFVGNAMNLNQTQLEQIVRLKPGEAIVHYGGMDNPIWIQVDSAKENLRAKFQASGGIHQLTTQMQTRRQELVAGYRRWNGCHVCDAPCDYLSEWNTAQRASVQILMSFVNVLLYADAADVRAQWRETKEKLYTALAARYLREQLVEGAFLCHLVQLARGVLAQWQMYYSPNGERFDLYVQAQTDLAEILRALQTNVASFEVEPRITAFRQLVLQEWARAPRSPTPGCVMCQTVCQYGYLIQTIYKPDHQALNQEYKTLLASDAAAKENFVTFVRMLQQHVRAHIPVPFAPDQLSSVAYCYLANSTARTHVLRGAQRVMTPPSSGEQK